MSKSILPLLADATLGIILVWCLAPMVVLTTDRIPELVRSVRRDYHNKKQGSRLGISIIIITLFYALPLLGATGLMIAESRSADAVSVLSFW